MGFLMVVAWVPHSDVVNGDKHLPIRGHQKRVMSSTRHNGCEKHSLMMVIFLLKLKREKSKLEIYIYIYIFSFTGLFQIIRENSKF
jgi:hypothetical protein